MPEPAIGLNPLVVALAALGTACMAWIALPLGLNPFGWIYLIYLLLVLGAPLFAILLQLLAKLRPVHWSLSPGARGLALMLTLGLPIGLYSSVIGPRLLRLETPRVEMAAARAGERALKIGILADIQTHQVSRYEREAVDRLMALNPDLILLPGDVHQASAMKDLGEYERQLPAFRELLARLEAPGGVYFVTGNMDPQRDVPGLLEGTGVRWLDNEIVDIEVAGWSVSLGGNDLHFAQPESRAVARDLNERPGEGDLRILMSHMPDAVYNLPEEARVDLVIAGHTHGGQVRIPFFGPPLTLSSVPRPAAAGGLSQVNGNRIYVSRGLGMERGQAPPLRFLVPPEITLLEMVTK